MLPGNSGLLSQKAAAARPNRRPDIQGLRAVALVMAVAFHAGLPVPGGFVGVDIFFVISGYVVALMLQREWASTGSIGFRHFYLRRFQRLTPALAVMVSCTVVISALVLSPLGTQQATALTAAGSMVMLANVAIAATTFGYFGADANANPLLTTWSLSVEEQFYLFFPLILFLSWMVARRIRRSRGPGRSIPILVMGAVTLVSLGLALWVVDHRIAHVPFPAVGYFSPFTRAWEFAAGALLALGLPGVRAVGRRVALACSIVGMAMLVACPWVINGAQPYPGVTTLLPVIGTLLVILGGVVERNPVSSVLATGPFVKLGDWSYSVYLWHWPVIVFAAVIWPGNALVLVLAALLSFVPALIAFRWVEEPSRKLPPLGRTRTAGLIAVTLAVPLALAMLLWVAVDHGYWNTSVQAYQAAVLPDHLTTDSGCLNLRSPSELSDTDCLWNASASGRPIYLVGDSHADHLSEAVVGAGTALGSPVRAFTPGGCPLVAAYLRRPGLLPSIVDQCNDYMSDRLAWLEQQAPGIVVIANSDGYWTSPDVAVGPTLDTMTTDPTLRRAKISEALKSTVERLQRSGHDVLLVQDVPQFEGAFAWLASDCSTLQIARAACVQEMPLQEARVNQGWVHDLIEGVAKMTSATTVDLTSELCPANACLTVVDGVVRYRDSEHLTVPASEALVPQFTRAVRAAVAGGIVRRQSPG